MSNPRRANGYRRDTAQRDRLRRILRRDKPPCHICGGDIDYALPYLDPQSFVVDHVIPLALGGPDTIQNAAAAHRACNRTKGDKLPGQSTRTPAVKRVRAW